MAEQGPEDTTRDAWGAGGSGDGDDWDRIEPLFDHALDLLGAEREVFLEELERSDPRAHARLSRLLEAAGASGSMILDQPIEEAAADLVEKVPLDHWDGGLSDGDRIGGYRILRPLGGGGMGHVFIVEPGDGTDQLALKVLSRSRDREELRRRFERERAILEGLRHPLILPLVDHGVTDDDRPYFVMRLLDGESITDFCRERRLRVEERLQLFLRLCDAVRHAHQRGVVHRDLKPSNVLVEVDPEGEPQPFVLDFGIAHEAEARDLTLTGQIMGTPGYMAPEQARGEIGKVDRRSDVFSLGAILYELLTDQKAYRGRNAADTLIAVIEQQPPRVRDTHPVVASDLDLIVHRAMTKERELRYSSVGRLVDDLEDYLEGRPLARMPPPSQTGSVVEGTLNWEELAARQGVVASPARRRAAGWTLLLLAAALLPVIWWAMRQGREAVGEQGAVAVVTSPTSLGGGALQSRTSRDLADEAAARLRFAHLAQLHDLQPTLRRGADLLSELRRRAESDRVEDRLALIDALWARRDVEGAGPLVFRLAEQAGSVRAAQLDLSGALSVLAQSCWDHQRLLTWWEDLGVNTADLSGELQRTCRDVAVRLMADATEAGSMAPVVTGDRAVHGPLWRGDRSRATAIAERLVEERPWRFEIYLDLAAMAHVVEGALGGAEETGITLSAVRRAVQQGRSDPLAHQRLCQEGSGAGAYEACRASLAADASRAWPRIEMLWFDPAAMSEGAPALDTARGARCGPRGRSARRIAAVAPHSVAAHLAVVRVCLEWSVDDGASEPEVARSVAFQALERARSVASSRGSLPVVHSLVERVSRRLVTLDG